MVMAYTVFNIVWLLAWMPWGKRIIGVKLMDVVKDIVPFLGSGALVMAATYFATAAISNLYLLLAARIVMAAALYYGVMRLMNVVILQECLQFLFKKK